MIPTASSVSQHNSRQTAYVKCLIASVIVFFATHTSGYTQIMHLGLKSGFNYSWTRSDDAEFRRITNVKPVPGFNAGAVFSFKMKDRYFLHTEVIFSTKGKITVNDKNNTREDAEMEEKVIYNYIEVPILYNIHFKGKLNLKNVRHFKWYAGIGPNFSYWLGGKGTISHYEISEFGFPNVEYKLKFAERTENESGDADFVYLKDVKRFQLGVNVGGGILLEPNNGGKVMIDARFEIGHTWLGTPESADYAVPAHYRDNLRARNLGVRLSVMYLLETNLDKKVRNKGKSSNKNSRKKRRR